MFYIAGSSSGNVRGPIVDNAYVLDSQLPSSLQEAAINQENPQNVSRDNIIIYNFIMYKFLTDLVGLLLLQAV